ncbi:histidine phosphatase family protein [Streptomyces sp. NPDC048669]|uniref:histidine phosphatase family protein n=1 Tax=Streptomyces sp. NPDC048669 TaxID=3155267 RepID=UPI0034134918
MWITKWPTFAAPTRASGAGHLAYTPLPIVAVLPAAASSGPPAAIWPQSARWRRSPPDERFQDLGHVTVRVDAFLGRVRPLLDNGDVAVVAHGHLSRVLAVRRLGLDASAARQFGHPRPGTVSTLGYEHGRRSGGSRVDV